MQETADAVVLAPATPAPASVIWLHGLGADGHDFVPIVPELKLPASPAVRFVFPHAAMRAVTLNMGMRMRAWYDIRTLTAEGRADEAGLRESLARVAALVAAERALGVESERIVIAGFSQGAATALHAALRHPEPLAGVLALSTYLVLGDKLPAELQSANRGIPIFAAHGTVDPMVHVKRGLDMKETLEKLGCRVEWHSYPMEHSVCVEELADIGAWMNRLMGA